jgi:hypothetical protein
MSKELRAMRTAKDIYSVWAPEGCLWSPWIAPVLFYVLRDFPPISEGTSIETGNSSIPFSAADGGAVVVDLPGAASVDFAMMLVSAGFRPVPLYNSSPAPGSTALFQTSPAFVPSAEGELRETATLSMRSLLSAMNRATEQLSQINLSNMAPPAFLLDSRRLTGDRPLDIGLFDNRWMVFPQDFPSAQFLKTHGIRRILLVQETSMVPMEDLAHVLLRWQEGGLELLTYAKERGGSPESLIIPRPSWFRKVWYRALAILRLRRNPAGGFGGFFPGSSSG